MHSNKLFLDGTEVRKCPKKKQLYCSRDGKFYRLKNAGLIAVTPSVVSNYNRKTCHTRYPIVTRTAPCNIHVLMALTWIGPRPQGYEIDHLNGDILNWSADNLQYVTPEENRRRAVILRELRANGTDPAQLSREQLISLFNA